MNKRKKPRKGLSVKDCNFAVDAFKPTHIIEYNDEYNEKIIWIIKTYKDRYGTYLRSTKTTYHPSYRYLYEYIMKCTEHLPKELFRLSIRIWWVLNKWQDFPVCEYPGCTTRLIIDNRHRAFRLKINKATGEIYAQWPRHCCNEHALKNPTTRQKYIDHCQELWGVDNAYQAEPVKSKCRAKLQEHYGVDVPAKSPIVVLHMQNTCEAKYGEGIRNPFLLDYVQEASHSPQTIAKMLNTLSAHNMEKYNVPWYVMTEEFAKKAHISNGTSKAESFLGEYIKTLTTKEVIIGSFRIITPKLIDVYIPELKLAFEFNGIYYHSFQKLQSMTYHLDKTQLCEEKGIKLIHIWEDWWYDQEDECKTFIKNAINNKIVIDTTLEILELDRSRINKCWNIIGYKLIDETEPQLVKRGRRDNAKYYVADCGKLIYQKIH